MADQKISQLTDAGAPQNTDQLPIARSGSTLSILWSSLKTAIAASFAPLTWTLTAGAGLTGGGDLSANRTVALATAGPGATGPIGDSTHVAAVTINDKGQVTALTSVGISGGVGGWTKVNTTSNQNITNSSTLTASPELTIAMAANTKYILRGYVFFDSTAAGDFKYGFTAPASPTLARYEGREHATGNAVTEFLILTEGSSSFFWTTNARAVTSSVDGSGSLSFTLIWHNASNTSPNFQFYFSQNTATADAGATVLAGSFIEYTVVA